MKIHIIYCHPSSESLTYQIKQSYIAGLKESDIDYTISDLYGMDFKSDMDEMEYLCQANYHKDYLPRDVLKQQELMNNSDILTFIFPIFWMDCPSKLVGWFQRVFTYGYRYDDKKESMKTFDEVNFLIVMGSGFDDLKADGKIDAIKTVFEKDRISDNAHKCNFYFFTDTAHDKLTPENKNKYLNRAFELAKKY